MNPGLVVKLRPSGPWRIGPDSGARNRVDVIYHSDSLYSAITSAMARLGWLEEWLAATARTEAPAVAISSCFPYLDDLVFVAPPRTVWPPASQSASASRVRWKSARFVPLAVVQSILAGERLEESRWSVDGPSDCLVPAGKHGPFRTAVRSNAGVDRLTGASERHSTACLEFRAGSGLWTVASFADEAASAQWSARVKAAFRLLADSGFGGERSRGWGRSEAPEFTEGMLPDLILPLDRAAARSPKPIAPDAETPVEQAAETAPAIVPEAAADPPAEAPPQPAEELEAVPSEPTAEPAVELAAESVTAEDSEVQRTEASVTAPPHVAPLVVEAAPAGEITPAETPASERAAEPAAEEAEQAEARPAEEAQSEIAPEPEIPATTEPAVVAAPVTQPEAGDEQAHPDVVPEPQTPVTEREASPATEPEAGKEPAQPDVAPEETPAWEPIAVVEPEAPAPAAPASTPSHPYWLLSLFTPAPGDSVDWRRGNYTVLARGGRVDSPAGSGELKKQISMVAEGSVLYAEAAPQGSAADVAPEGFAHPVFRAGFAVVIPLPEVR